MKLLSLRILFIHVKANSQDAAGAVSIISVVNIMGESVFVISQILFVMHNFSDNLIG